MFRTEPFAGRMPRAARMPVQALVLLAGVLCSAVEASDALWGNPASQKSANGHMRNSAAVSAIGVELGARVNFRGVGTVFYAGWSQGDVYFADLDEPGGFTWEEAVAACQKKGAGWSLPSASQLDLLRLHADDLDLLAKEIESSSGNWYWSSTRYDRESAWRQRFSDGLKQPLKSRFAARVRCVRVY